VSAVVKSVASGEEYNIKNHIIFPSYEIINICGKVICFQCEMSEALEVSCVQFEVQQVEVNGEMK
jgi:hypothetical protein